MCDNPYQKDCYTESIYFINRKYDKDALVDIIPESIKAAITRFVYSFDMSGMSSDDNSIVEVDTGNDEGIAIPIPVRKSSENAVVQDSEEKSGTENISSEEQKDDIQLRLEKLNKLYKQGLISEEDYNKRKNEILSEI